MRLPKFLSKLLGVDWDTIELAHGHHDVVVPTHCRADKVFLSVKEEATGGCDHHGASLVSHIQIDGGFHLHADVKGDTCRIEWFVSELK